ncbi:MAG: carbohydrate kinase family protein [bacterium]|nr:carbohydrate kinase family protein [bacterium]
MTETKLDLLAIGDTTTDVFMGLKDASVIKQPEKRGDKLCLRFGDKIAVESVQEIEGVGNAANVAVGASRLGLKTGIWTILGNDDDGQRIVSNVFEKEGVLSENVIFDQKERTNYSLVLTYNAERTILSYHAPRVYEWPQNMPEAKWVYFTSLGQNWEKIIPDFLNYVQQIGCKVAFNPGSMQLRSKPEDLKNVLSVTDTLFVNREEAEKICGCKTDSMKELLIKTKETGPKNVVITDGVNGAHALLNEVYWTMPVLPTTVLERTGCGDSFATGFLAALIFGKSDDEALLWGAENASSVISYVGSRAGLLKRDVLLQNLEKQTIKAQKI